MNYKHLGRTGLRVSRIGLGTMNFGELTDESASFRIMDEANTCLPTISAGPVRPA